MSLNTLPTPDDAASVEADSGIDIGSSSTSTIPDETVDPESSSDPVPWGSASIAGREGAAHPPVRLVIGSLGIDAPIIAAGVDDAGVMDVPDNVTDVAWYRFGSNPGEQGSAVLAAHVDLAKFGPGVFFDIDSLEAGEEVKIYFDDGSEQAFSVNDSNRVSKVDLDVAELFAADGPPVVRLVTCGGGFNPELRRYDSNVIVTLVPVGGG